MPDPRRRSFGRRNATQAGGAAKPPPHEAQHACAPGSGSRLLLRRRAGVPPGWAERSLKKDGEEMRRPRHSSDLASLGTS